MNQDPTGRLELGDRAVDRLQLVPPVDDGSGVVEAIVIVATVDHMGGGRPEVLAWIPVETLTLVAAMIYPLGPPLLRQRGVRERRPALAGVLHPLATVEGAALQRAALFRMCGIGAAKPRLAGPVRTALPHAGRRLRADTGRDSARDLKTGSREDGEPKFIGEIVAGKDPRKPPAPPIPAGMTVAHFLDSYYDRYVVAESLRSVASIRSRVAALKAALGTLPVSELERVDPIEDFKRSYGETKSTASVNRALAILRHAINWGRGRTPPIFTTSPFHRFGVKIKTKGETKRDRRVGHDEEQRLLAAADKLDCAEHGFAGAAMRDRIVGALETGCRLGEMLKIQNRHVVWNTHQISIPAEHAKDAESRRIPFEPKGRLAQLLKRRRFLGANGYAFGTPTGQYQGTIRTAWESLVLLAHGIEPTRTRARGRVNREQLAEIDLHWHDLRHEAACRWLPRGLDLRAIQLLLGHADLKTTQRYLNVTDEELRKTMQQKLWSRKS